MDKMFDVGKIVNTHGVRGEVRVIKMTDYDERFSVGSSLYLVKENELPVKVTIAGHRVHKQFDLIHFEGLTTINDVEHFKDAYLKINEKQLPHLKKGEFFHHDIIGCQMQTTDGDHLGTITSILSPGANDVWVVEQSSGKELLIPYIKEVVKSVDIEEKKVMIELMEGLLD